MYVLTLNHYFEKMLQIFIKMHNCNSLNVETLKRDLSILLGNQECYRMRAAIFFHISVIKWILITSYMHISLKTR